MSLSTQYVFACFKPWSVAPTNKLTDRQSAARVLFAQQAHEVALDQYATSFRTLSNDNHQKLVTRLIFSCTYQYHHSHLESKVWLNTIDSSNVLTIYLHREKDLLHRSLSGMMAETFFKNSKCNFTWRPYTSHFTNDVTAECLLLGTTAVKHSLDNWAGGSFLYVVFEADTYKSVQNTVSDTRIWHFSWFI